MDITNHWIRRSMAVTGLALLLYIPCMAQDITIRGTVVDKDTQHPISSVSVVIGRKGTATNSRGEFVIRTDRRELYNKGILFSHIGYATKKQTVEAVVSGYNYTIELEHESSVLSGVTVTPVALNILERAIDSIPRNYPVRDFVLRGIFRDYQGVNDSTKFYRFYKDDALLSIYFPGYLHPGHDPQVSLVGNRSILYKSRMQFLNAAHWIDGYLTVPSSDFVHVQSDFIRAKKLKRYNFFYEGVKITSGTPVYVIRFQSKEKNVLEGTLYIDSASYAFAGADLVYYNRNQYGMIPIKEKHVRVSYTRVGSLWYLDQVRENLLYDVEDAKTYRSMDFKRTSIDTVNVIEPAYGDVIQSGDQDIKVNRTVPDSLSGRYDSMLNEAEKDGEITIIPIPKVITNSNLRGPAEKRGFGGDILSYVFNDNIRSSLGLTMMPVKLAKEQAILQKPVQGISNYGLSLGLDFRLYKSLWMMGESMAGYAANKVENQLTSVYVSYDFLTTTNRSRRLSFSILAGYVWESVYIDNTERYRNQMVAGGGMFSFELKHRVDLFLRYLAGHPLKTWNGGLAIDGNNGYLSAGVTMKLR